MSPKRRLFAIASGLAFGLDYITKSLVVEHLDLGSATPVIDGLFYLTHVTNPGAAFSMFRDWPEQFRIWFFPIMGVIALAMVFSFYRQLTPGDRLSAWALGSILGGACGNLYDRIFRGVAWFNGEVVDFLHVRLWAGTSFPDFNFADAFIITGVALLILELFASEGESVDEDPRGTGEESV